MAGMAGMAKIGLEVKTIAGLNALVYLLHGAPKLSDRYFDITGAISFAAATSIGLRDRLKSRRTRTASRSGRSAVDAGGPATGEAVKSSDRGVVASAALLVWCTRLGSFLLARVLRDGRDRRMDPIKAAGRATFAIPWAFQVVWCTLVGMPVYLTNRYATDHPLDRTDAAGLSLWLAGFAVEVVADRQKQAFAEAGLRATQGYISSGLWSLSRHPNYAGEITLWLGLAIFAWNSIRRNKECPVPGLAAVSPAFTFLLLRHFSGVPLLEKANMKAFGKLARYQQYIKATPVLFPSVLPKLSMRPDRW